MPNLKLKSIKITNFGIYRDLPELDFSDKTVVGILGVYADNEQRSNRSGKSIFAEAIRYNLTGLNRGKKSLDMIHKGEKYTTVECTYTDTDTDNDYKVIRGVDHKGKGILTVDWTDKVADGEKSIKELFGVSKEDFDLTSFFKQSDINGFMDLSPPDKTKHLMKWVDNEHWKTKHVTVMADVKLFQGKLNENEATKKALEVSLEVDEGLKNELSELLANNKNLVSTKNRTSKKITDNNKKITVSEVAKEGFSKQKSLLLDKLESIASKLRKEKTIKLKIKEILGTTSDYSASISSKHSKFSHDVVLNNISSLKMELSETEKFINNIDKNKNGTCPLLGESCDRITYAKKDRDEAVKKSYDLNVQISKLQDDMKNIKNNKVVEDKITYNNKEIKRLKTELKENKIVDKSNEIIGEISILEKKSKIDTSEIKKEVTMLKTKLSKCESQIRENDQKIGAIEQRIAKSKEALGKIDKVTIINKKLKNRLSNLKYVAKMFSGTGIPADEIDNSFMEVEKDINYILKKLDCGLTVSFSPDRELSAKEDACSCGFVYPKNFRGTSCEDCGSMRMKKRKDEISLKILENGEESDFNMDSGGGRAIISYAVRIALTMLKRRQNGSKLNMLFLDEVDSALDSHLASTITDSIANILTKELGYDQILMVSHKEEIKRSVPNTLEITRFDKHSTARFL